MFQSSKFDNARSLSPSPQDVRKIADDPAAVTNRSLLLEQRALERGATPAGAANRTGFSLPPPIVFGYILRPAVVVAEGAAV
jgi:hypothetical protein